LDAAPPQGQDGASARALVDFLSAVRGAAERSLAAQTEDVLAGLIADLDEPPSVDHTPLPPPMPLGGGDRLSDIFPARLFDAPPRVDTSRLSETLAALADE